MGSDRYYCGLIIPPVRRVQGFAVIVTAALESLPAALLALLVPIVAGLRHAHQVVLPKEEIGATSVRHGMINHVRDPDPYRSLLAVGALAQGMGSKLNGSKLLPSGRVVERR